MTRHKLIIKALGLTDACATFYVQVYRGQVWIEAYDCPFTCEAILDPAQADHLVDLINQTTEEARGSRP